MLTVIKRDGSEVQFDFTKIIQAIKKAQADAIADNEIGFEIIDKEFFGKLKENILEEFSISDNKLASSEIQDVVNGEFAKKPKYKNISDRYNRYKHEKFINIIKRNGTIESFNLNKIFEAINKSAERVNYKITKQDYNKIKTIILMEIDDKREITIDFMHGLVEKTLYYINKEVAESYTNYRNYKNQFGLSLLNSIEGQIHKILEEVDRSNSNSNSRLISTKRIDIAKGMSKELYQKIHLNIEEVQAIKDGYIYAHDLSDLLLPQYNCLDGSTLVCINGKTQTIEDFSNEIKLKESIPIKLEGEGHVISSRSRDVEIKAISKRSVNEKDVVYRIQTGSSQIIATENHRFPVISNGVETIKHVKDINSDDSLLVLKDKQTFTRDYINMMSVAKSHNIEYNVFIPKEIQHFLQYKYNIKLAKILNYKKSNELRYLNEYVVLSSDEFDILNNKFIIPYDIYNKVKIGAKGSRNRLPLYIKKDENLAYILGCLFADGYIQYNDENSSYQTIFSNTNIDLLDMYKNTFNNVFKSNVTIEVPAETSTTPCLRVSYGNKIVSNMIKNNIDNGYKKDSANIKVPDFIINGSNSIKMAFLSAIIDCDGCYRQEESAIFYVSVCEEYINDIIAILESLDVKYTKTKQETKGTVGVANGVEFTRRYDMHKIRISTIKNFEFVENIKNSFKINKLHFEHTNNGCNNYDIEPILEIIKLSDYNDYVYDIQTEDGWFIANDILTHNCILFDMKNVLEGGFEIENIFYTEPKDIKVAVGQMGDVILAASSQNFGGFTVPLVDELLSKYYKMSIDKHEEDLINIHSDFVEIDEHITTKIKKMARDRAYRDLKQSLQGIEIKVNTIGGSRGSFTFSTFSFGKAKDSYEADISKAILEVRMEGHGKPGFKKSLIFPKLVFVYDEEIHGEGKEFEWLFKLSLKCSSQNMYPDYIGTGHVRENKVVSPMGKHI